MLNVLRALAVVAAFSFAACGTSEAPTCSAAETPYTVCSEGSVWECPRGTDEQLAKKKAITDACGDDTQCLLRAKYEMYPMTVKVKCAEGGLVCVEAAPPAQSASCQMK
jgi:hypothetical protein